MVYLYPTTRFYPTSSLSSLFTEPVELQQLTLLLKKMTKYEPETKMLLGYVCLCGPKLKFNIAIVQ